MYNAKRLLTNLIYVSLLLLLVYLLVYNFHFICVSLGIVKACAHGFDVEAKKYNHIYMGIIRYIEWPLDGVCVCLTSLWHFTIIILK